MERYDFDVDGVAAYALEHHGPACGIGLQFPEGLVAYGSALADRLQERLPGAFIVILGDVLYGACNVDDCGCAQLGLDLLVHFGHSRAVQRPLLVDVYYVPVERTDFDPREAGRVILEGLGLPGAGGGPQGGPDRAPPPEAPPPQPADTPAAPPIRSLALVSTAQYCSRLGETRRYIEERSPVRVHAPRFPPLNEYELLGCTCKAFPPGVDAVVSVADGEFHLEAAAIANPSLPVYRLDPNLMALERSAYDAASRIAYRRRAVAEAREASEKLLGGALGSVGIVFGTMGRQGSERLLRALQRGLEAAGLPYLTVGLAEVLPQLILPFPAAYWVQLACPRLSFDWGRDFREAGLLVLNAYEAFEVLRGLGGPGGGAPDLEDGAGACGLAPRGARGERGGEGAPYCLHNFSAEPGDGFAYEPA